MNPTVKPLLTHLPLLATLSICGVLLAYGPIAQLAHYHDFADQSIVMGVPHAADVLSNLGFAVVALWGMMRLWPLRNRPSLQAGRHGYALFLVGLLLTAFGSSYYHLAPDNARLVWDRLPIALACAGLLAAVRADCLHKATSSAETLLLGGFGVCSVAWWVVTAQHGIGDLRPYLLLQGLLLLLIPLWQAIYQAPVKDRMAFGIALLLYVAAKAAEVNDHQLLDCLGVVTGHTLKHLLATGAAAVIVAWLVKVAEESVVGRLA